MRALTLIILSVGAILLVAPGTVSGQDVCTVCDGCQTSSGRLDPAAWLQAAGGMAGPSDLVVPTIQAEPGFTRCTCNQVFWTYDGSVAGAFGFFLYSTSDTLGAIDSAVVAKSSWDYDRQAYNALHCDLDDGTYFYRIRAFSVNDTAVELGPPSAWVYTTTDNVAPQAECWMAVDPGWYTVDTFTLFYQISDPAGVDAVLFYYRDSSGGDWTLLLSETIAGAPESVSGSLALPDGAATTLSEIVDGRYEFIVAGRDAAEAPDWEAGDEGHQGNTDVPTPDDSGPCWLAFDLAVPEDTIWLEEIQMRREFEVAYTVHDIATAAAERFHSGVDTVRLYQGEDDLSDGFDGSGAVPYSLIDAGYYRGVTSVYDTVTATVSASDCWAYFYLDVTDSAGNRLISDICSTRVFVDSTMLLRLYPANDPDDYSYTNSCQVTAEMLFLIDAVDSFRVCQDPSFATCVMQYPDEIESDHTPGDTFAVTVPFDLGGGQCDEGVAQVWAEAYLADGQRWLEASAITLVDQTAPYIYDFELRDRSGQTIGFTTSREVLPYFTFIEVDAPDDTIPVSPTQWYVIDEANDARDADSLLPGGTYTLSEEPEPKVVEGWAIDMAENASSVAEATVHLYEKAHSYPNPFNPDLGEEAHFVFVASDEASLTIAIYDRFGLLVREWEVDAVAGLNDGRNQPGLTWDGRNGRGSIVASGGYTGVILDGSDVKARIKIAVIK